MPTVIVAGADFEYDSDEDVCHCPQGKKLKKMAYKARKDVYQYRPRKCNCDGCSLRLACFTPKGVKTILRSPYKDAIEQAQKHLQTEGARQVSKQQRTTAEWVVAEAKNFHGLRRAQQRELENVSVQVILTATVQNLMRLMVLGSSNLSFWRFRQ